MPTQETVDFLDDEIGRLTAEIERLRHWRKSVVIAANAILAPMTGEFGRIMEEAPDQLIELTLCSREVQISASKFMALYWATET